MSVFNSFVAAPFWGDIDNTHIGEIWYEVHASGWSTVSNSLLERVSNLVRSEQNAPSFQGIWMLVATWNGSVPFAGTGEEASLKSGPCMQSESHSVNLYTLSIAI